MVGQPVLNSRRGAPCRRWCPRRGGRRRRAHRSSGNTRSTIGRTRPSASIGTTSSTNALVAAALSATDRGRSTVPCISARFCISPSSGTAGMPPASVPTITMRPPGATAATSAVTYGPPTRSMTTSGAPPCSAIRWAKAMGSSSRGARTPWSMPSAVAAGELGLGARGAGDRAAERLGELHDRGAHAGPDRVDEDVLAGPEPGPGPHRVVRGDEHLGHAAGRHELDRVGDRRTVRRGHDDVLGLGAAAGHAEHAVADRRGDARRVRRHRPRRRTRGRGCPRERRGAPDRGRRAAAGRRG